jgi:hypothetical protein
MSSWITTKKAVWVQQVLVLPLPHFCHADSLFNSSVSGQTTGGRTLTRQEDLTNNIANDRLNVIALAALHTATLLHSMAEH